MKIAITDACIFIDLHDLNLTTSFLSLNLEIHTSLDVFNELYDAQKEILKRFVLENKLVIHNIESAERFKIMQSNYPKSLSEMDKTVLFLAEKLNAIVLSSDKAVRNCAKSKAIQYHGILWIFDQLIENNLLKKLEAFDSLNLLLKLNGFYRGNSDLMKEVNLRLSTWQKR
jgi:predicted nucleic acid-binding protein